MPNLPSEVYWEGRAAQRMDEYLRDSEQTLRTIGGAFSRANDNLLADIDRIFGNYAKRHSLTPEQAKAYLAEPVSHAEYERLLAKLPGVTDPAARADLLARINAPSAAYRMSREVALQSSIYVEMFKVADVQIGAATAGFQRTINDAYGRTLFGIQRGTGLGWRVDAMSPGAVREILRNPWSGISFDDRIWTNQRALGDWLNKELTAGIASGRSVAQLSRELSDRVEMGTGMGYREAERLVRTETCYMANAAEMRSYKAAGITRYRFLATLDNRTSDVCQELDGQVFDITDAMPGKNMPPMHPRCRSTTVADFGGDAMAGLERRARDPVTGELTKVPASMTYGDWRKTFVADQGDDGVGSVPKRDYTTDMASKLGTAHYDAIRDRVDTSANEDLKKIWEAYEGKIGVGDANLSPRITPNARGSNIFLNIERDAGGSRYSLPYSTTFHESGHAIDSLAHGLGVDNGLWKISATYQDGAYPKMIKREVMEYVKAVEKSLQLDRYGAYKHIGRELYALGGIAGSDISDIMEGATNARIRGVAGHGANYWKQKRSGGIDYGLATEAFAEMLDATINNPESLRQLKRYLPKSYAMFDEMLRFIAGKV